MSGRPEPEMSRPAEPTAEPGGAEVELPAMPATGPLYRRAAVGLAPGFGAGRRADRLPGTTLVVREVTVDRDHLSRYDRVCGFRLADALPPRVGGFREAIAFGDDPQAVVDGIAIQRYSL